MSDRADTTLLGSPESSPTASPSSQTTGHTSLSSPPGDENNESDNSNESNESHESDERRTDISDHRGLTDDDDADESVNNAPYAAYRRTDISDHRGLTDDDDADESVNNAPYAAYRRTQGHAERCRRRSRRSGGFHVLRHGVVDEDTSAGFRLWGFHGGVRVYRLESALRSALAAQIVHTAVGPCYMDLDAVCPPTVVPAAADGHPTMVNGAFSIRPSPLGGLGAFSVRPLAPGEHILVERPLLRTDLFYLCAQLATLSPADRAAYDSLCGHHPDPRATAAERVWTANTFVADDREAIFVLAARFNHACQPRPNVAYRYDGRRGRGVLVLTTVRAVAAGEELCISYGDQTPAALFRRYGFRCTCGACAGYSEAEEQVWRW